MLKRSLSKNRISNEKWTFLNILICLFSITNFYSQNLVPNPSFEEYTECPTASDDLPNAIGWSSPMINSGEYFNRCSNYYFGVPNQGDNYQESHTGDAFVGIFFYSTWLSYREYAQVKLNTILSTGKYYYCEFWVNRAAYYSGKYAVNNIGLSFTSFFSDTSFSNGPYILDYEMNIYKFGNQVIEDTLNWIKISGIYKANGTENYLIIGNFKSDFETSIINLESDSNNLDGGAFYYIDDVLVEEIFQPFWQYHDTTIYCGDSVLIGPALTGLDIDWYTDNLNFISNAPGIYVTPPTSRDYIAKETFNGVETEHVVHVTVIGGAGLEENALQHVRVFPNPSKGSFSISGLMSDKPLQLEVRDVHGKLVFSQTSFEVLNGITTFTLDVDNGIYLVNVINPITKESTIEKLVIHK
jgi:hypothetical protein